MDIQVSLEWIDFNLLVNNIVIILQWHTNFINYYYIHNLSRIYKKNIN